MTHYPGCKSTACTEYKSIIEYRKDGYTLNDRCLTCKRFYDDNFQHINEETVLLAVTRSNIEVPDEFYLLSEGSNR